LTVAAFNTHEFWRRTARVLPSFFIVGPPRTGTSWLHEVLKHRVILPSSTKETRFFDLHFHRGLRWYEFYYPVWDGARRVGEVAPTYFAYPEARSRIKALLPNSRIVCIFRDPLERLISLYRLKVAYGMMRWDLDEALSRDPELVESSRYATHLAAWQKDFGTDQVLAVFYDDLLERPQRFVDTVCDFIHVPRFKLGKSDLKVVNTTGAMTQPKSYFCTRHATLLAEWLKARHCGRLVAAARDSLLGKFFLRSGPRFTDAPPETILMIYETLREEIGGLESLVNRDLSAWKEPIEAFQAEI
jgi:hypothetical protein